MIQLTIKPKAICPIPDQKMVPTEGMSVPQGGGEKNGTSYTVPRYLLEKATDMTLLKNKSLQL